MPPSQLQITTSSLQRLMKEEASYMKEMDQQRARIDKLKRGTNGTVDAEGEEGNREYSIRQEEKALKETETVLPSLREKIANAREKLESVLDTAANDEEREKAIDVLKEAKEMGRQDPVG